MDSEKKLLTKDMILFVLSGTSDEDSAKGRGPIRNTLVDKYGFNPKLLTRKILNRVIHKLVIEKKLVRITNEKGTKPRWYLILLPKTPESQEESSESQEETSESQEETQEETSESQEESQEETSEESPESPEEYTESELKNKKVKELKIIAKSLNIVKSYKMKKSLLIESIMEAQ